MTSEFREPTLALLSHELMTISVVEHHCRSGLDGPVKSIGV